MRPAPRRVTQRTRSTSKLNKAFPSWYYQEPVDWRTTDVTEEVLKGWYRTMQLARRIDHRCQLLNRQGRAPFVIAGAGHEAVQMGVAWTLQPRRDWLAPYARDLVICLRMGVTALDLMLGVLAKSTDPASGGKQTPGHFSDRSLNLISTGSPLGTQLVHAAGIAYAFRLDNTKQVVLATYGDGTGSEGDVHEAMNFAGIYKLPVIFLCENNRWAISVPFHKQYGVEYAAQRAAAYGFSGITVDGRDPVTCYHAAQQAVALAREGGGPTLIEAEVDRLGPHSSEDDQSRYRSKEELEQLSSVDCLATFRARLLSEGVATESELSLMDDTIDAEVSAATDDALRAPDPDPTEAVANVYAVSSAYLGRESGPVDSPHLGRESGPVDSPHLGRESGSVDEMNIIEAIRASLDFEMDRDPSVLILGEDVGPKGGVFLATKDLYQKYGEDRVIDMPVAESSIAGIALGLALAGKRPVAEIQFSDFAHMAFNQITNEIAKFRYRSNGAWEVPLVIRAPMGGHVRGGLYHSQSIEARFATPGLTIVVPSSPRAAKGLLLSAIRDPDPVLFLEHKKLYRLFREPVPSGGYSTPLRTARKVRDGSDVSVFCYGLMVHYAELAAEQVKESINVEIIDLQTVYPLDCEAIVASARKTARCLVLYEDNYRVSIGSEVAAIIADEAWQWLDAPVKRLGGLDVPAMPYAQAMEDYFMPNPDKIANALRELVAF